jgi:hypothetical protein
MLKLETMNDKETEFLRMNNGGLILYGDEELAW